MQNYDVSFEENHEDWVNLSEPVKCVPLPSNESNDFKEEVVSNQKEPKERAFLFPILTLQLAVVILLLSALLTFKSLLPKAYSEFQVFYQEELSRSMISDGDFYSLDYSSFFNSTNDEV